MRMVAKVIARFCVLALLLTPIPVSAQVVNPEVAGSVAESESGDAIVGATVSVEIEGRVIGTVTDPEGFFTLQVPEESRVLIVRASA